MIHVLMYYRVWIPSLALCGDAQFRALAEAGEIEYRCVQEDRLREADFTWADVVILPRLDSRYQLTLAEISRQNGKLLAYMIDDDLLHVPPEMNSYPYYHLNSTQRHIQAMLDISDAVFSPSPLLLRQYARADQLALQVEEPALYTGDFIPHDPGAPVTIGFAGSMDRSGDLGDALRDALTRIQREYGERVRFGFFGGRPDWASELGAEIRPYCKDYPAYLQRFGEWSWDIGLAPMQNSPFHARKHYIKLTEYAAAGVAAVCSEVPPYDRAKAAGMPAVYVDGTAESWYSAIRDYLDHPEALEKARRTAWQYARAHCSAAQTARAFQPLLTAAAQRSAPDRQRPCHLTWNKGRNWVWKGANFIRIYKWRAPIRLIQRSRGY